MPVSKNKRKSRKGQNRKESKAKAANNLGGIGFGDQVDSPLFNDAFPFGPHPGLPGERMVGMSMGGGSQYKMTSPPDNPALSEMEQIDAIIERSVTFETTEAHHDNIGLREITLDGEMSGGDIMGPMVASVQVDPLSAIEGTPQMEDGAGTDRIPGLGSQRVQRGFRRKPLAGHGSFVGGMPSQHQRVLRPAGNQRLRKRSSLPQCDTEVDPEETHFHILDDDGVLRLCDRCWAKGPLPEVDGTLQLDFQGMTGRT